MKKSPLLSSLIPWLLVSLFTFTTGCQYPDPLPPLEPKGENFNEEDDIKLFLGQYKDFTDPIIDQKAPLKTPNQDDLETLFKFMRKYNDSLLASGPGQETIRKRLFIDENNRIDLNKLLEYFRFKPEFKNVSFTIDGLTFNRAKGIPGTRPTRYDKMFNAITLKDATFDGVKIDNIDFSGSILSNVTINDSSLNDTACLSCAFENVTVTNSVSRDTDFSFSSGSLSLTNSNVHYLKITDSKDFEVALRGGQLSDSSFINTPKVQIEDVTQQRVLTGEHNAERKFKAVGLVYRSTFPGGTAAKILNNIRDAGHNAVRIEYGLERFVDAAKIKQEVIEAMKKVPADPATSVAQKFLTEFQTDKTKYPELATLDTLVEGYIKQLDGLIIPGGLDVEPFFVDPSINAEKFYTEEVSRLRARKDIVAEPFPIRSALEIFLLDKAIKKQIPLLLVCRGAHLYNAFKNGRIIPNLADVYSRINFDNHQRFMFLSKNLPDPNNTLVKLFKKQGKKEIAVYGNHHQAIDPAKVGNGLQVVFEWSVGENQSIPYGLYDTTYNAGAWLTQFHPEVKEPQGGAMAQRLSPLNELIYTEFYELMK